MPDQTRVRDVGHALIVEDSRQGTLQLGPVSVAEFTLHVPVFRLDDQRRPRRIGMVKGIPLKQEGLVKRVLETCKKWDEWVSTQANWEELLNRGWVLDATKKEANDGS